MSFIDDFRRINPDEYQKQEEERKRQEEKTEYDKKFQYSLQFWKSALKEILTVGKQNNLFTSNHVSGVLYYDEYAERTIFCPCDKQWLSSLRNPIKTQEKRPVIAYGFGKASVWDGYVMRMYNEFTYKKYSDEFTIKVMTTALEELGFSKVRAEKTPVPYYHEVDGFFYPHYVKDMKEIPLYSFSF